MSDPAPENPKAESRHHSPLPAGFGLSTATFVVVSSMVGVGVLTTSGRIVAQVGSNSLMLWLWAIGGLIALCGAFSLAELAAMLPRSGGEYVFLDAAYGPRLAFLAGWSSLLIGFAAPIAAATWAAADYLIAPFHLAANLVPVARIALATICIMIFSLIHSASHRQTNRIQGLITILELVILGFFVVVGLIVARHQYDSLHDLPQFTTGLATKSIFALVYVSYGYTGWNAAAYVAGEVIDGRRRLPLAILLGTLIVTLLYVGLNLVYALALPASDIQQIVATSGEDAVGPIAELTAKALFGTAWSGAFSLCLGLILLATASAYLLTGPRVMFAMARAGHFPQIAAQIHQRHGTPASATIILAVLSAAFLWSGSFDTIVVYAGVGLSFMSLLSVAAVYVLRVRQPDLPRPFRVPFYPFVPAIYLVGTTAVIVVSFVERPVTSSLALLSLLLALPGYDVWMRKRANVVTSSQE
jgi:APA family basic amino acid/polyamine antiporter